MAGVGSDNESQCKSVSLRREIGKGAWWRSVGLNPRCAAATAGRICARSKVLPPHVLERHYFRSDLSILTTP